MNTLFLDTEFSGLTQGAELLSLALVADDGSWFYAVFTEVDTATLSSWHQENVVPHLELTDAQLRALPDRGHYLLGTRAQIISHLRDYLEKYPQITIWADVPAYDWVLFCELFGGALSLPKHIHYIVRDLATLLEVKGYDVDVDRFWLAYGEGGGGDAGLARHSALGDALGGMACLQKLSAR